MTTPLMQLSLLHPLGTMSHRVFEGDLKQNKKRNILVYLRVKTFMGMLIPFE
jgi:hypothetical protein